MANMSIARRLSRRTFLRGAALAPIAPLAAQLGGATASPEASPLEQLRAVDPELADLFSAAVASVLALAREYPDSLGLRTASALAETAEKGARKELEVQRQGDRLDAAGLGAWRGLFWSQSYHYRMQDREMEDLVSALENAPHAHAVAMLEAHRDRLPNLKPRDVVAMTYLVRHPGADSVPESVFDVLD